MKCVNANNNEETKVWTKTIYYYVVWLVKIQITHYRCTYIFILNLQTCYAKHIAPIQPKNQPFKNNFNQLFENIALE